MGDHASFGISGSATCIDEESAFSGLLARHLPLDRRVVDFAVCSQLQEIFPQEHPLILNIRWNLDLRPHNDSLNLWHLIDMLHDPSQAFFRVDGDHFSIRMVDLVEAGRRLTRRVEPCNNTVTHQPTHKRQSPLRRVKAHNRYTSALLHLQVLHRLSKQHGLLHVLGPRP